MSIDLSIKINNSSFQSLINPIRIINANPIITWEWNSIDRVTIDAYTGEMEDVTPSKQIGFEIRISSHDFNLGTNSFVGNTIQTGFITSEDRFWNYTGIPLVREKTYYGQLAIKDELNRYGEWVTFAFYFNSLPTINNVKISPSTPSVNDDLHLSYSFYDKDDDPDTVTIIRWFKNSVHQRQFNNNSVIKSVFLQINDVWVADVLPSDGYEYGVRVTSPLVKVIRTAVIVTDIAILPEDANENDMLKAEYVYSSLVESDNPTIRWFINGSVNQNYNNKKYIRPDVEPGDTVRFEIRPEGGTTFVSSPIKTISYSDFVVYGIKVDSQIDSLEISTISPTVKWEVYKPINKEVNYVSIKIGTFFEANNIYSTTIQTDSNVYSIPSNILNKGEDYYISIAVSDVNSFSNYSTSHFRIKGSGWKESVNNITGWTIELIFLINSTGSFSEENYQIIRLQDGSKFGEIKIHHQKISFISGEKTSSNILDTTGMNILTIVGQNNDVKIYFNRKLIIDATAKFDQTTTLKKLEIGNSTGNNFSIKYKYFYYTVSGAFHPGIAEEFSNIKFHNFINFTDNEITSLEGYVKNYQDNKIFGINPDNENESGSLYAIIPAQNYKNSTVSRTFSPINSIKMSPNNKKIAIGHSKGISLISGYIISPFDHELDFLETSVNEGSSEIQQVFPQENGWELISTLNSSASYIDENGLNINTIDQR